MRICRVAGAVAVLGAAMGLCLAADKKAPASEGITREQADAILNELKEMRSLLEKLVTNQANLRPPAPQGPPIVSVRIPAAAQMLGSKDAPYTMVEYIDLQCPFCKRFEETTFAEIRKNLIDTGKLRYYSRDFPLEMHQFAMKAAVATHCAAEQGQFWRMRDMLVTNASNLSTDAIAGYAKAAGLNTDMFNTCLAGTRYDAEIRDSLSEGAAAGVQGTPTFIIGKSQPDGVTGSLLVGAMPYAMIEAEVKKLSTN